MTANRAHQIVAASMVITALVVALAQDWVGHVEAWIIERTHKSA